MSPKFSFARFIGLAIFAFGEPFCLGLVGDPFWMLAPWAAVLAFVALATGWGVSAAARPAKSYAVAIAFMVVAIVPFYAAGRLTGWLVSVETLPATGGPDRFGGITLTG
jgi:hypothetical protein